MCCLLGANKYSVFNFFILTFKLLKHKVIANVDWSEEMEIVCIGGGPAWLYFGLLMKKQDPSHGADMIDCSSGQVSKVERPVYGRMFQTPFEGKVRNGRHAVVTGAGQGIGAAVAIALAAGGASVTLLGRRTEPLKATAALFPKRSKNFVVAVDVTHAEEVDDAFVKARERHGPVSILVNNAGQAESAPFANTSLDLWNQMLAVNLTGTFLCSKAALPDLLLGWGRIVNIASTAAQRGYAYASAYAAAKHGVLGLTRSLALEFARKNVTINAVCPGYTDTELLRASIRNVVAKTGRTEQAAKSEFEKINPQNRLIQPAEVAATVLWLCSESAVSFNGQALSVSGGEVM